MCAIPFTWASCIDVNKLDRWLTEWAEEQIYSADCCGYSGINIVERILRDPGRSTKGSRHKVLWWPRNYRVGRVSRAMHQIPVMSQLCLIVEFGKIVKPENGQVLEKHEFSINYGFGARKFDRYVRKAKNKLSRILWG